MKILNQNAAEQLQTGKQIKERIAEINELLSNIDDNSEDHLAYELELTTELDGLHCQLEQPVG